MRMQTDQTDLEIYWGVLISQFGVRLILKDACNSCDMQLSEFLGKDVKALDLHAHLFKLTADVMILNLLP